jgi:flagellar hook-basal body complex protein FliE
MINKIYGNIKPFGGLEKNQNSQDENFSNTLNDFLQEVNELQLENKQTTEEFLNGEITDLHQVTIAAQKARVSMELLLQVRNKLIESYQEIMRMQV